jgi:hypothetical protein
VLASAEKGPPSADYARLRAHAPADLASLSRPRLRCPRGNPRRRALPKAHRYSPFADLQLSPAITLWLPPHVPCGPNTIKTPRRSNQMTRRADPKLP